MNKSLTPVTGKEVKFILNEPAKEIKHGLERESILVSREKYGQIAAREYCNMVLLNHCQNKDIMKMLKPELERVLHTICQETVTTGAHPMIRKKAIWALRHYCTTRSADVLADLAVNGEDEYVKSEAISSLGAYKMAFCAPLLIEALQDSSDMVKNAAQIGLKSIGTTTEGNKILITAMNKTKNSVLKKQLEEIIEGKIERKKVTKLRRATKDK
jgi:HEAT repeat protein